ncbi:hypothetical protein M9Y10_002474 [Tritrichomonas musculus]|uniref:Uncharacterized protein n=1 Tax=Tritrichomonas musculus TaxID=1915356 RepID=A0ABR2LAX0_9EUKA
MYQRSSKHNFALAFYNLGHLKEIELQKKTEEEKENQELEEYIEYYKKASDSEDCPLIFHNRQFYDKRLEMSKTFIICMTNLKLCEYYFNKGDLSESKEYFTRSFKKLLNDKVHSTFSIKNDQEKAENFFIYLKSFILSFPLFNLSNQPNLNIEEIFNLFNHDIPSLAEKNFNEESITNEMDEIIVNQEIIEKIEKRKNLEKEGIKKEIRIEEQLREEEINFDNDEMIFKDGNEIFEFIISNEKYRDIFSREIHKIIQIMNEIIYTPPYPILFGRISISKFKQKEEVNPNMKEINELFYEGLGLEEFKYEKES